MSRIDSPLKELIIKTHDSTQKAATITLLNNDVRQQLDRLSPEKKSNHLLRFEKQNSLLRLKMGH